MLVYSNTWVLGNSIDSQWTNVANILEIPILLVLKQYSDIYIEFVNNETNIKYYYDLSLAGIDVLTTYPNILSFLTYANGYINDDTLITNFDSSKLNLVNYFNMFSANYEARLNNNFNESNILNLPTVYNSNLILTNKHYAISNAYIYSNCLITINGFLYDFFINNNNEIEVINGGKGFSSILNSQVGVLNFSDLGGIQRESITLENITNLDNLYTDLKLTTPSNFNPNTQSLLISVGGYLVILNDDSVFIDDNNLLNINLSELNFVTKYIETSLYMDLDNILYENEAIYFKTYDSGVDGNGSYNPNDGTYSGAISNELILNYLSNTPWFYIILNTPKISIKTYYPQISNFPGCLVLNTDPIYPLVTYTGRIVEYDYECRKSDYKINVLDEILKHVLFIGNNNSESNTFYGNWCSDGYSNESSFLTSTASFLKIYNQT